jgi:hypothetical protein
MIERMSSNSAQDTPTSNPAIPISPSYPQSRSSFFKTKSQSSPEPSIPSPIQLPPKKEAIEQIDNLSASSFKPLPTLNQSNTLAEPRKKFPTILIILGIVLVLLIGGLVAFSIFGERILNAMFGS